MEGLGPRAGRMPVHAAIDSSNQIHPASGSRCVWRQLDRVCPKTRALAVLNLLKQSDKKGITVKEIAGQLGVGVNRTHTWFYNARKSLKQIKKVGPGKYLWQE